MKKFISCVIFVLLFLFMLNLGTDILTPKAENRYYMLEKYLEEHPEDYLHDVQIFGSCHAYTSFNPVHFEELTGVSAFVYGNAGEIIPTTYVRMVDQFKIHTPKVALVEIWGMNPYETYSTHERVFGFYLANNLERTKFSLAKQEVIADFGGKGYEDISFLTMNFPLINYKDRVIDGSLTEVDFNYKFEDLYSYSSTYTFNEMTSRLKNHGYKANPCVAIEDYPELQNTIPAGDMVEIEPDIVKYLQKIIDLCKDKGVELIFYRSPYTSTENELRKLNHLHQICAENDVLFIDLEAQMEYDYKTDFLDYQHLSEIGANKATEYLMPYIMDAMGQPLQVNQIVRNNMLTNSDFLNPQNQSGQSVFTDMGYTIDNWKTNFSTDTVSLTDEGIHTSIFSSVNGWHFYQNVEDVSAYWGESVTAYFSVPDFDGNFFIAVISFRNAEDQEIAAASVELSAGEFTVTGVVPPLTESMRVGIFARDRASSYDYFCLERIELYKGAYTKDTLPSP